MLQALEIRYAPARTYSDTPQPHTTTSFQIIPTITITATAGTTPDDTGIIFQHPITPRSKRFRPPTALLPPWQSALALQVALNLSLVPVHLIRLAARRIRGRRVLACMVQSTTASS